MRGDPVTGDEQLDKITQFQAFLATQEGVHEDDQKLPEDIGDWVKVWATATCHNQDCDAYERGCERTYMVNGNGVQAACGGCGNPPTLVAACSDGLIEIPNTYQPYPAEVPDQSGETEGPMPEVRSGR